MRDPEVVSGVDLKIMLEIGVGLKAISVMPMSWKVQVEIHVSFKVWTLKSDQRFACRLKYNA